MREIKFRAWIDTELQDPYMAYWWADNSGIGDAFFRKICPATEKEAQRDGFDLPKIRRWQKGIKFMQYTGLKDKNGKEIYEGDVIEMEPNNYEKGSDNIQKQKYKEVVEYFEDSFGREIRCSPFHHSYAECEVIGNINENPELLNNQNQ